MVEEGRLPPRATPLPELLSDDGSVAPADTGAMSREDAAPAA
jgi:hypothetical protein